MKTDWKFGDRFCYCVDGGSEDRGWFDDDKIIWKGKYEVNGYIGKDYVVSNGWIFYFDEIKPVIQIKREL